MNQQTKIVIEVIEKLSEKVDFDEFLGISDPVEIAKKTLVEIARDKVNKTIENHIWKVYE